MQALRQVCNCVQENFSIGTRILLNIFGVKYVILKLNDSVTLLTGLTEG